MTAPIPMDLIALLESRIGQDFDQECHLTDDEARLIVLALSQAQGRIGELEAELEATQAVRDEVSEELIAATFAKQAAEGLLKEAGEVVRGQLLVMRLAALKFDFSLDGSASTEAAVAFLLKLSPGEGGGSAGAGDR